MANPLMVKGNKLGGGKKGRSGRKSLAEEVAKMEAIQKAWNKVNNEIEKKDVEKVALPIALKTMADKSEVKTKVIIEFDNSFKKDAEKSI